MSMGKIKRPALLAVHHSTSRHPDIRRVYLDQAHVSQAKKEPDFTKKEIEQLRNTNAQLLELCEQLMSQEEEARKTASDLRRKLKKKEEALDEAKEECNRLQKKYDSMKERPRHIKKECDVEVVRITFGRVLKHSRR
ncbi:hypothetical protein H0H92_006901 [Tricholoma furcatifolium]|nr:hypothetical protein H0H92_006901 [Tricholoma furcatifolium]